MNRITLLTMVAALAGSPTAPAVAQESNVVPTLVSFSGTLTDLDHKLLRGIVGVTFCIYRDQQGGTPLWMETQNVQLDKEGKYAVQLGSTKSHGLPTDLFASGEARFPEAELVLFDTGSASHRKCCGTACPTELLYTEANRSSGCEL